MRTEQWMCVSALLLVYAYQNRPRPPFLFFTHSLCMCADAFVPYFIRRMNMNIAYLFNTSSAHTNYFFFFIRIYGIKKETFRYVLIPLIWILSGFTFGHMLWSKHEMLHINEILIWFFKMNWNIHFSKTNKRNKNTHFIKLYCEKIYKKKKSHVNNPFSIFHWESIQIYLFVCLKFTIELIWMFWVLLRAPSLDWFERSVKVGIRSTTNFSNFHSHTNRLLWMAQTALMYNIRQQ